VKTPITDITYTVANANDVNVTGLPAGVTYSYDPATGIVTISGVPTASGTFTYTVTPTGCGTATASGTITVQGVDVSVTQSGSTLTAVQAGATYQWMSCPGYQAISGATGQSFTPSVSGSYAVVVTVGSCQDTSQCYMVSASSVSEGEASSGWRVYAAPLSGAFMIENRLGRMGDFELVDVSGRVLDTWRLDVGIHEVRVKVPRGLYFVRERRSGTVKRLVIE